MKKLAEHHGFLDADAYQIWNMGNEAYISTSNPAGAIAILEKNELEGRVVGQIREAQKEKTGITIHTPTREIYYSGKD